MAVIARARLLSYARGGTTARERARAYFLTTRPTWVLILLLLLFTALAMTAPVVIRRWIPLEQLRTNNEV
ncbi:MAG TPA: hypothetical protein VGG67_04390, partial [Steroidobacteraceae bacterium]